DGLARLRPLWDRFLLDRPSRLQAMEHLVCDLRDLELPGAEREVEVLGLLEAHLADDLREEGRARELLVGQVVLLECVLERLAAALLGVLARLPAEPLADLVTRARRGRERHPVARRAAAGLLGGEDLDEI